jgi:hypothetical protein
MHSEKEKIKKIIKIETQPNFSMEDLQIKSRLISSAIDEIIGDDYSVNCLVKQTGKFTVYLDMPREKEQWAGRVGDLFQKLKEIDETVSSKIENEKCNVEEEDIGRYDITQNSDGECIKRIFIISSK